METGREQEEQDREYHGWVVFTPLGSPIAMGYSEAMARAVYEHFQEQPVPEYYSVERVRIIRPIPPASAPEVEHG